ncbi:type I restriction endonuclease subunit M [Halorubrum sp. DTA98]|uniref:type I restriction endonuclease subunit M n=1 Tax=Halorubrum sp. DTA98 TaxID=3402163 RepID=UPI003AAAB86C
MSDRPTFERWGRGSRLYRRYTENATTLLETDEAVRRAHEKWLRFFVASHGDVLTDLPGEAPEVELFVDSLYFDLVVDRLLEFAERTFGFALANREPRANTDALSVRFRPLHERVVDLDAVTEELEAHLSADALRAADADAIRSLYESIVPREIRLELGEYYTPRGVAELAVGAMDVDTFSLGADAGAFDGGADAGATVEDHTATTGVSFLDPGCGSGVFLSVCIDRLLAATPESTDPADVVSRITSSVAGIDLNPVAVTSAKLAYVLALLPALKRADADAVEIPVFLTDALGITCEEPMTFRGEPFEPSVTHLVGNPPWITWGRLPDAVKRRWRETYVDRLDLFPHDGIESRLGHANDDVSVPFVWVCIDRYLREGGQASFVLKRNLSKGPAGTLFRTLAVGDRSLDVTHVHDFNDLHPFGDQVNANAAVYTLAADAHSTFPIDTTSWTPACPNLAESGGRPECTVSSGETAPDKAAPDETAPDETAPDETAPDKTVPDFSDASAVRATLTAADTELLPLDPDDDASTWVRRDAERAALGACDHDVRHGVKDDAQDVFSIDRETLSELEPDLVYPYIKSRHVVKYGLFGHELRLVPIRKVDEDNEAELRAGFPNTYEYLSDRREALAARSSSWLQQGPFYNVFGLGEYTWADYKVVWCRLGFKPHFAVVSTVDDEDLGTKQVVPGDHFMFIATDDEREAHFLCALLNSAVYQRSLTAIASDGKASLSKAVVSELRLPEWRETADARRLAELSVRAHGIVPEHTDTSKRAYNGTTIDELERVQAEIDRIVERLVADDTTFL